MDPPESDLPPAHTSARRYPPWHHRPSPPEPQLSIRKTSASPRQALRCLNGGAPPDLGSRAQPSTASVARRSTLRQGTLRRAGSSIARGHSCQALPPLSGGTPTGFKDRTPWRMLVMSRKQISQLSSPVATLGGHRGVARQSTSEVGHLGECW